MESVLSDEGPKLVNDVLKRLTDVLGAHRKHV